MTCMALIMAEGFSLDFVVLAAVALVIAGWVVISILTRRDAERKIATLNKDMEAQLSLLRRQLEQVSAAGKAAAAKIETAPAPLAAPAPPLAATRQQDEIPPEVILVITAAVTAFLGKKVRIRSAKRLQTPYEIVNPWAQQGRVFVQASHNLGR